MQNPVRAAMAAADPPFVSIDFSYRKETPGISVPVFKNSILFAAGIDQAWSDDMKKDLYRDQPFDCSAECSDYNPILLLFRFSAEYAAICSSENR